MKRITILIIDDDFEDVELFCEAAIEVSGNIDCVSAGNGEEAIQILNDISQIKPDFIFLDLNMPRLNGKQFLQIFKKNPVDSNIPVIIYTTSKLKEDIEETKLLGATSFLTKPSKLHDLKNAISLVLARKWDQVNAEY